jgi:hypothetical protein
MNKVKNTNKFFCKAYKELGSFATSPYNWSLYDKKDQSDAAWILWLTTELPLKICLSPILAPATAITIGLALSLASIVAAGHLVTLTGAVCLDASDNYSSVPCRSIEV